MTHELHAEMSQTEQAARRWLWQEITHNIAGTDVPLYPYAEFEEREIEKRAKSAYIYNGAVAAILFTALILGLAPRETAELAFFVIAIVNLGIHWGNRRTIAIAHKFDQAFFQTVYGGETDLSIWPSFSPVRTDKHVLETAQDIAKRSFARPSR